MMSPRELSTRTLRWLQHQLLRARGRSRGRTRRSEIVALTESIESCRRGLIEFGSESDRDFTSLAKGLGHLSSRLTALRTQSAALGTILQDRDEDRAISAAYALYKDSVDLVHASAGIAVSAQDQLTQVEAALVKSCGDREHFERDHMFLRIVTLSIRIEASRLPAESQAVFLNVASAIAETGQQIQECTSRAFARIEAVIEESRDARRELQATENALHVQARKSIETIQRELQSLQSALAPCAASSCEIDQLFATAQPQTLQIIGALQHQDIVRQQLEHVSAGFEDLENHFIDRPSHQIEWDYALHAAKIQSAQLAGSRREIEVAGEKVIGGLQTVLETSDKMVARFSEMEVSAASALDHCQISEMFTQEIQSLNRIIERSQQANTRTARLVERIEEVVLLFSTEIRRYELDVKVVALNAQIAAARLSSADALNRLAEETSHVSDANAALTRQLSADLQNSLGKLDLVKREGSEFLKIVTRERAELETGLGSVKDKLSRLVDRVRAGAVQAREDFAPLHEQCQSLLEGLTFPSLIAAKFTPAATLCDELAELGARHADDRVASDSALAKIRLHESRYTMHKEGTTHKAVLGTASESVPAHLDPGEIELFSEPTDLAPSVAVSPEPAQQVIPVAIVVAAAPAVPVPRELGTDTEPCSPRIAATVTPPPGKPDFGDGIELF